MKIAISSAKAELYGYRKVAVEAVRKAGITAHVLDEHWGLKPRQLPDVSMVASVLKEVQQCDALIALLGRDKGLRATKNDPTLIEHEIIAAEQAGIPVFAYVTRNSRLFNRLEKSKETHSDVTLLSQSEVVRSTRSSDELLIQLSNDIETFLQGRTHERKYVRIEIVKAIHWPTLAAHPEELLRCSPRDFEEIVAELLRSDGWEVDLVVRNNAPGADIIACSSRIIDTVPVQMIVECKRLRENRPVDIDVVRKLVYWVNEEFGATLGMIATTSHFTSNAKQLVETKHRWRIALRDQEAIRDWIRKRAGYKNEPNEAVHRIADKTGSR